MRGSLALSLAATCLFLPAETFADPPAGPTEFRYPRVYGATGRPYGPTQAHYQYQRRYGRPWHGQGGERIAAGHHHGVGYRYVPHSFHPHAVYGYSPYFGFYYGASTGLPGYAHYGPHYSYIPAAPLVIQAHPEFIGKNPFNNRVLREAREENALRWGDKIVVDPQLKTVERPIKESTPAAKLKSLRAQHQGDHWFGEQEYGKAYRRYKKAVEEADDRADAHFSLAYALVALGRYDRAVRQIKRGLRIDPEWPKNGESLTEVFGSDNLLAKSSIVSRVADWVREDIRDPDRLFLIGVLLHFDDDDRAAPFLTAALRLAGGGEHLLAFLDLDGEAGIPQAAAVDEAAERPKPAPAPHDDQGPPRPPGDGGSAESTDLNLPPLPSP